jgi:hypothetical protein
MQVLCKKDLLLGVHKNIPFKKGNEYRLVGKNDFVSILDDLGRLYRFTHTNSYFKVRSNSRVIWYKFEEYFQKVK